jgi:hypothetical protein
MPASATRSAIFNFRYPVDGRTASGRRLLDLIALFSAGRDVSTETRRQTVLLAALVSQEIEQLTTNAIRNRSQRRETLVRLGLLQLAALAALNEVSKCA